MGELRTTPATSRSRRRRSDGERSRAAILDAAAGGPPDIAALGEVMRRHGLTPAP